MALILLTDLINTSGNVCSEPTGTSCLYRNFREWRGGRWQVGNSPPQKLVSNSVR